MTPKFRFWVGYLKKMITVEKIDFFREKVFERKIAFDFIDGVLMQWTGLLDKNGKEIYEGDIVRYPSAKASDFIGKVFWMDNIGSFMVAGADNHWRLTSIVEVVGNVHENPELLK